MRWLRAHILALIKAVDVLFPGPVRGTRMQCIHKCTLPYIVQREQYSVVVRTVVSLYFQPHTRGSNNSLDGFVKLYRNSDKRVFMMWACHSKHWPITGAIENDVLLLAIMPRPCVCTLYASCICTCTVLRAFYSSVGSYDCMGSECAAGRVSRTWLARSVMVLNNFEQLPLSCVSL